MLHATFIKPNAGFKYFVVNKVTIVKLFKITGSFTMPCEKRKNSIMENVLNENDKVIKKIFSL